MDARRYNSAGGVSSLCCLGACCDAPPPRPDNWQMGHADNMAWLDACSLLSPLALLT